MQKKLIGPIHIITRESHPDLDWDKIQEIYGKMVGGVESKGFCPYITNNPESFSCTLFCDHPQASLHVHHWYMIAPGIAEVKVLGIEDPVLLSTLPLKMTAEEKRKLGCRRA